MVESFRIGGRIVERHSVGLGWVLTPGTNIRAANSDCSLADYGGLMRLSGMEANLNYIHSTLRERIIEHVFGDALRRLWRDKGASMILNTDQNARHIGSA